MVKNKLTDESIAVIGMGCRFPGGANDPNTFWENLSTGKDCITEIPPNRYGTKTLYSAYKDKPGKMLTKWGGFIDRFDEFDPAFFGISPREAHYMDPQQRKLLEVTWEALEDGGQKSKSLSGKAIGVFIGAFTVDYKILQFGAMNSENLAAHTSTGSMMTMLSNRISYIFNFKGPSMTIDTACSSSLVTMHLACESIKNGECAMAIAGGTLLHSTPQYTIAESKGGFLSPHGWSHAFDASADGYVRAEGVGVIVLKKLSSALRDGDRIHAVIIGSGVNHNGHTNGITVPNPIAQIELIKKVCAKTGIQPGDIQYVEAHGTGTPVGDPIEANALGEALLLGRKSGSKCYIGSVKTNIGHTESAAGVAGIIKAILCLKNKMIPPHLHLTKINPKIEIEKWPYKIPTELTPWPEHEGPALAGVNSFGFGGMNAHIVLQEAPQQASTCNGKTDSDNGRSRIFPLTAKDDEVFAEMVVDYKNLIDHKEQRGISLNDIGYTASVKREHLERRLTFVYSSEDDLIRKFDAYLEGDADPLILKGDRWAAEKRKLVWVFTGMGPQWWAMGRRLFEKEPVYREMIERCDQEMSKLVDWSLIKELNASETESRMAESWLAQPANFALQVALAAIWRSFDIKPDAIIGHSTGEVAAFYEAGVYSLEDAAKIIIHRSRLQQTASGAGKMIAVGLSADEVEPIIAPYCDQVSIAAVNSPHSLTLSGNETCLAELAKKLEKKEVFCKFLQVQIPFHSPYMDPIKSELLKSLKNIKPNTTALPLYSTARGCIVKGPELDSAYWWENVRGTVLFAPAINLILDHDYRLFLEVGPHPVLANNISECMAEKYIHGKMLFSLKRKENDHKKMLAALAELHNIGFSINLEAFYPGGRFVGLPSYPWKKERFWTAPPIVEQLRLDKIDHPLLGRRLSVAEPAWEINMDVEINPYLADHKIQGNIVFPAAGYIEMAFGALKNILGPAACSLDQIEFRKALFLSEGEFKKVQFLLEREQSIFKIATNHGENNQNTAVHVAGKVRTIQDTRIAPNIDVDAIKSRLHTHMDGTSCYKILTGMGYHYGPCFQNIKEIWIGENEILADIRIADSMADQVSEYHMHPGMLDTCFQTIIVSDFSGLNDGGQEKTDIRLPISIEQIRIRDGEFKRLWAHARIIHHDEEKTSGNIILYDDQCEAVGEIKNFIAQGVDTVAGHVGINTIDNWLYEVEWMESELVYDTQDINKTVGNDPEGWLIFADRQGIADELHALLQAKGEHCCLVYPGYKFSVNSNGSSATIASGSKEDIFRLINTVFKTNKINCNGVIHLWNLDAPDIENATFDEMDEFKRLGSTSLLNIANAIKELSLPGKLWIVTRGAQAVSENGANMRPAAAAAWGIGRVLWYQELVEHRGKLIDLDPSIIASKEDATDLSNEIFHPDHDDEVAFRNGKRYISRLNLIKNLTKPLTTRFRNNQSYLVTGAFGALGQALCRMMVKHGAGHLVLVGRIKIPDRVEWSSVDKESSLGRRIAFIKELERMGGHVIPANVDMSNERQFAAYLEEFRRKEYPPISGVFHLAGVVKDVLISKMDDESFDAVYNPKVIGSYLLHKYFRNEPLEYFVLFSSIASLITTAGQTNYAAGNAFLDALAYHRRTLGLPALSVNWGPWAVGMIKELKLIEHYKNSRGMGSVLPEVGMDILNRVLGQDISRVAVAFDVNWPLVLTWYSVHPPLIAHLAAKSESKADNNREGGSFVEIFNNCEEYARLDLVNQRLIDLTVDVLHAKRSQIDLQTSLNSLGLDSILAVELRNKILTDFEYSLTIVNLLSGSTISRIAEQIYAGLCRKTEEQDSGIQDTSNVEIHRNLNEYPLTYGQKAIWFLHQLNPESPAYNIGGAIEIPGVIDVKVMLQAIQEFVARHPCLRTNFVIKDGKPVQRVSSAVNLDFKLVDVTDKAWEAVYTLITEESRRLFNLEKDPLVRIRLYKLSDARYILQKTVYHLVSDASSNYIFVDELQALYYSYKNVEPVKLPPVESTYLDFLNWQNKFLANKEAEAMFNYWKSHVPAKIPILNLPTDKPRPIVQTNNGASFSFTISHELSDEIYRLSQKTNATVFMILLSAFYILLHKYTSQEDIIVGSPVAGRTQERFSEVYGYFVNPLPLRASFNKDLTYMKFLTQVRQIVSQGLDNQEYPFALLVEKLGLQHDSSRSAVFQVMFILLIHRIQTKDNQFGFPRKYIELPEEEGQFDLTLSMYEDNNQGIFRAAFKYNRDLFFESTMKRMAGHYLKILEEIVWAPEKTIASYDYLTNAERDLILGPWAGKKKLPAPNSCIHTLIETIAARNGNRPAVSEPLDEGGSRLLSYEELNKQANQFARYLRKAGVNRNISVGICLEKTQEMVVAILAVLKAGGAYLPLDPNYPLERIIYCIHNSSTEIIITHSSITAISVALLETGKKIICMDTEWNDISKEKASCLENINDPGDLVYIVYTSGSTGRPKGVKVTHHNLVSIYRAWESEYHLRERASSHLQMANFSFDVFSGDFVRALCSGGKLVLCNKEILLNIPLLYKIMVEEKVDCAEFVPPVIRNLVNYLEASHLKLDFMNLVIVGSDVWKIEEYEKLKRYCGARTRVINSYGLSEATIDSTYFEGDTKLYQRGSTVPIGTPLPNVSAYILDSSLQPVPIGIPGELYIAGEGVAPGYIADDELTGKKFLSYHFSDQSAIRLYRTGDIAKWDDHGIIHLLERLDRQVKIRGHRIEFNEIEKCLCEYPHIENVVVIAKADNYKEKILCAYYLSKNDETIDAKDLRNWLSERLPLFMVPSYFMPVAQFPLTSNGKVDVNALPAPVFSLEIDESNVPQTVYEIKIAAIWGKILRVADVGLQHDFFEVGGSSIKLIELIIHLQNEFNIKISVNRLFKGSTLGLMSKTIEDIVTGKETGAEPYVTFNTGGEQSIYCFPPAGGYGLIYEPLARHLKKCALISFNYLMEENKIERYADMIQQMDVKGPYLLMGYSLGGNMAFEVGRELERRGCEVSNVIIMDSYRILESFEFTDEDLKMFESELLEHLKRHTGSAVLQNHTLDQAKDYIQFFRRVLNIEPVKARVNVILEENTDDFHKPTPYKLTKEESWFQSSHTATKMFVGYGRHADMLNTSNAAKNTEIIRRIVADYPGLPEISAAQVISKDIMHERKNWVKSSSIRA